jgi:uncharacterized coiled-coil DUF342 family protein
MAELIDPVVDKLIDHNVLISTARNENVRTEKKLEELKEMLFNTKNQFDVFDQINLRIAETNGSVKILDERLTFENKQLKSRMDEVDKKHDVAHSMFLNLQAHSSEIIQELSRLKDTYRK